MSNKVLNVKKRFDGWKNVLTNLSIKGKDKRMSNTVHWTRMHETEAETLYAGDDMARKIVDTPAEDMMREGFEVITDDQNFDQLNTLLESSLEELEFDDKVVEGITWGRLYGGAAILIGLEDGLDPEEPVDLDKIKRVSYLTTLSKWELEPQDIDIDPESPEFSKPITYSINPILGGGESIKVHRSRLLMFHGAKLPRRLYNRNNYWHDSVLNRSKEPIMNFQSAHNGIASVMQDFAQGVFKLKGLAQMISSGKDDLVLKRMELVDQARSLVNAVVIEDDESFERKVTSLTGVPDTLKRIDARLVQSTDVPHTILLGESPSGLGATGNSEIRDYYDYIARKQNRELKDPVLTLLEMIIRSKDGPTKGLEPEKWSIEFKPLWQLNTIEMTDVRKKQAETDKIYFEIGSVSADEIALSRFGGAKYSQETSIEKSLRDNAGFDIESDEDETGEE